MCTLSLRHKPPFLKVHVSAVLLWNVPRVVSLSGRAHFGYVWQAVCWPLLGLCQLKCGNRCAQMPHMLTVLERTKVLVSSNTQTVINSLSPTSILTASNTHPSLQLTNYRMLVSHPLGH
jgi:hypothetical protein